MSISISTTLKNIKFKCLLHKIYLKDSIIWSWLWYSFRMLDFLFYLFLYLYYLYILSKLYIICYILLKKTCSKTKTWPCLRRILSNSLETRKHGEIKNNVSIYGVCGKNFLFFLVDTIRFYILFYTKYPT